MGLEDLVATGEASGIGSMVAGAEALVAVGEAPCLGEVVVEVGTSAPTPGRPSVVGIGEGEEGDGPWPQASAKNSSVLASHQKTRLLMP